jgi:hypothetical protein
VDGHRFASKAEARRYQELIFLANCGSVRDLRLQPRYVLNLNGVELCTYVADFAYSLHDRKLGDFCQVVEDVKGRRAGAAYDLFRLKARLMKAIHGIDVQEYP